MARYYLYAGANRALVSGAGHAGLVGACVEARTSDQRSTGVEFTVTRSDGSGAETDEARYLVTSGVLTAWMR